MITTTLSLIIWYLNKYNHIGKMDKLVKVYQTCVDNNIYVNIQDNLVSSDSLDKLNKKTLNDYIGLIYSNTTLEEVVEGLSEDGSSMISYSIVGFYKNSLELRNFVFKLFTKCNLKVFCKESNNDIEFCIDLLISDYEFPKLTKMNHKIEDTYNSGEDYEDEQEEEGEEEYDEEEYEQQDGEEEEHEEEEEEDDDEDDEEDVPIVEEKIREPVVVKKGENEEERRQRKRMEKEKKRLEKERRREEKRERDKIILERERIFLEEKQKLNMEYQKIEEMRRSIEAKERKFQEREVEDKMKTSSEMESVKQFIEQEKIKLQNEKQHLEQEKSKIDALKRQVEEEKAKLDKYNQEEKAKLENYFEEEKVKIQKERHLLEQERINMTSRLEEEKLKIEKEKAFFEQEKIKPNEKLPQQQQQIVATAAADVVEEPQEEVVVEEEEQQESIVDKEELILPEHMSTQDGLNIQTRKGVKLSKKYTYEELKVMRNTPLREICKNLGIWKLNGKYANISAHGDLITSIMTVQNLY
jgi:hypothetical protein